MHVYTFKAKVWLYDGPAPWHFISVPQNMSEELSREYAYLKRGWGSLPVEVTIGKTSWVTSIFPDKKNGTHLLPLKKSIRDTVGIKANQTVEASIKILGI